MKYFFEYIQLILLRAKSKSHRDGGSWIFIVKVCQKINSGTDFSLCSRELHGLTRIYISFYTRTVIIYPCNPCDPCLKKNKWLHFDTL